MSRAPRTVPAGCSGPSAPKPTGIGTSQPGRVSTCQGSGLPCWLSGAARVVSAQQRSQASSGVAPASVSRSLASCSASRSSRSTSAKPGRQRCISLRNCGSASAPGATNSSRGRRTSRRPGRGGSTLPPATRKVCSASHTRPARACRASGLLCSLARSSSNTRLISRCTRPSSTMAAVLPSACTGLRVSRQRRVPWPASCTCASKR